jgi:hypothetical protein
MGVLSLEGITYWGIYFLFLEMSRNAGGTYLDAFFRPIYAAKIQGPVCLSQVVFGALLANFPQLL